MATGLTTLGLIESLQDPIRAGSLVTLRERNLLVPTVTVFRDTVGMDPRKVATRGTAKPRQVAEGEDITPTRFDKSDLSTLTPVIVRDQFLVTDQRVASERESIRDAAVMELGGAIAEYVDEVMAALFTSLTGGTIGSGGGTIGWNHIMQARAKLQQNKVMGPYFCTLGAGQWYHLAYNGGSVDSSFTRATAFADRLVNNYFQSMLIGDVTFVVTANVSGGGGGTAYGAMYSREAMAYDERKAFSIEFQRDASREATELNASLWYAAGTWRPTSGIQLVGTDVIA